MRIGINHIGLALFSISSLFMIPEIGRQNQDSYEVVSEPVSQESSVANSTQIFVQVTGAVTNPGLYSMNSGERINDLLTLAGTDDYNHDCINLAQILVDEQNLYVPADDEKCVEDNSVDSNGVVNINTASSYELETIPGIGTAKASAIITYRDNNGTFEAVADLTNVEGISDSLLQSIQQYIKLS